MKNKKLFSIPILMVVAIAGLYALQPVQTASPQLTATMVSGPCIQVEQNGIWKDLGCYHNLITDYGRDQLKVSSGQGAGINQTTMSVANCTNGVVATDGTLCNAQAWASCGLTAQSAATYVNQGTGQWNITYQWTTTGAGCTDLNVSAAGISNATGANPLAFEATFTPVLLQGPTNDKINVTWGIVVS